MVSHTLTYWYFILDITLTCFASQRNDSRPTIKVDAHILGDLLNIMNWKSIFLITNKDSKVIYRSLSSALVSCAIFEPTFPPENAPLAQNEAFEHFGSLFSNILVWCEFLCQQQIILLATQKGMFTKSYGWLFVADNLTSKKDILNMQGLPLYLRPDSSAYIFSTSASFQEYGYEFCRIIHDGPKNVQCLLVATYTKTRWNPKPNTRSGLLLKGFTLRVGTLASGSKRYPMSRNLDSNLGFNCKYVETKTGFGTLQQNGNWTGLIGMLQRKEIDITSGGISLTKERLSVSDFSNVVGELSHVALIRKPSFLINTIILRTYMQPFPLSLWLTTLCMCALSFICLLLSFNFGQKARLINWKYWYKDADNVLWSTMSLSVQPSVTNLPKNRSSYVSLISLLLFVVVVNKSYNTFLVAALTFKKTSSMYETVEELLNDGVYGLSITFSTAGAQDLKDAKEGILARIWKKITENPANLVPTYAAGYVKVYKEKVAFLTPVSKAKVLCEKNCSYTFINDKYLPSSLHLGLQKNSPFYEAISSKLMTMQSAGVLKRRPDKKKKENKMEERCEHEESKHAVGIYTCFGCFAILGCGHVPAFCTFCFECFIKNTKYGRCK